MANGFYIKGAEPDTLEQACDKICREFMYRYHTFIRDVLDYEEKSFGKEYGFYLSADAQKKYSKDTQQTLLFFQSNVFSGRFLPAWEKEGYDRNTIWGLKFNGLLSHDYHSNYQARMRGETDFYYISQQTAKEIRKTFERKE